MKLIKRISSHWQPLLLLVMAIAVFCFWYFLYPYLLLTREMSQLFLWNGDYFMERIVVPGGLAQYLAEFIVQFFQHPLYGAFAYAAIFLMAQRLAKKVIDRFYPSANKSFSFILSLIPALLTWWVATIPTIPLTPTVALLIVMAVIAYLPASKQQRRWWVCALIPVVYWLTGPMAVLLLFCALRWIPLTAALFAACLIGSSYLTPYPLRQVVKGIDYDWSSEKQIGTFEEMECDMLERTKAWETIISQYPSAESPAVLCAVILAEYQTKRISWGELTRRMMPGKTDHAAPSVFNRGSQHLIVNYGSLVSAFMVSDIAFLMHLPNVAQRVAFDAMEYIPNYNKSGRALKRLIETAIITGQYDVAEKYISILEETLFYRNWAQEMRPLIENPERIKEHSFYKESQDTYAHMDDLFFI